MKLIRQFVTLGILLIVLMFSLVYFPTHLTEYTEYIYTPLQTIRNSVLGYFPVSFGDVLYVAAGASVIFTLGKWIFYATRFATYKRTWLRSSLNAVNSVLGGYLLFMLGWGFNYDKQPLREFWDLGKRTTDELPDTVITQQDLRAKDSLMLITFDTFLVNRLNTYAASYQSLSFHITNERAKGYYRICTDSKVKESGIEVKRSLFGYFLQRTAIDGYYNPFTGEGQVDADLPGFVLPFVICHEMAHQAGIAAEGDANLMAYAIGTLVNDSSFNYSCYLNIWLYANNRLYRRDSTLAKSMEAKLNKLTRAHLDTLDQLSLKYNNTLTRYSGKMYDSYLKMQNQKDGIRSYGSVTSDAWRLELHRKDKAKEVIKLP